MGAMILACGRDAISHSRFRGQVLRSIDSQVSADSVVEIDRLLKRHSGVRGLFGAEGVDHGDPVGGEKPTQGTVVCDQLGRRGVCVPILWPRVEKKVVDVAVGHLHRHTYTHTTTKK